MRKPIIGVIGGGYLDTSVAAIGGQIILGGGILLTGGDGSGGIEVKDAAMTGAINAGSRDFPARLISILPSHEIRIRYLASSGTQHQRRLFLDSGMDNIQRDVINGMTPDVLICFEGGRGTLCELAFAIYAKKPVLYWKSVSPLQAKLAKHLASGELQKSLTSAIAALGTKLLQLPYISEDILICCLNFALSQATDFAGNSSKIAASAIHLAPPQLGQSGFPSFLGRSEVKEDFEALVGAL